MQLSITFRHMEPPTRSRSTPREGRADPEVLPRPHHAPRRLLDASAATTTRADVNIHAAQRPRRSRASETTEDMYSSIDLVMARIERQVRKYKEQDPRPQAARADPLRCASPVVHRRRSPSRARRRPRADGSADAGADRAAAVDHQASEKFVARPMTRRGGDHAAEPRCTTTFLVLPQRRDAATSTSSTAGRTETTA